jgi:isopentenyl-diphosphate delta-isomerase
LGVEEYELCPVFLARVQGDAQPDPAEVAQVQWWPWARFVASAAVVGSTLSPWAQAQVRALEAGGQVAEFLTQDRI